MSQFELPDSWAFATISEVAIKGEQRAPDQDETFTYVDIGSIDRVLKRISDPQILMGKNAPSRARKAIRNGDVLVSLTRPNLNAVALVTSEFDGQIASTGFEVIRPCLVDSRYIFGLTRSKEFIDSISGAVQGALYPAAKSSDVQGFKFPLPPLAEQKIIADKLDILLAQVESIKARLERIPEILKQLRQSVLAAAVSGKLTEEWREEEQLANWATTTLDSLILESANGLSKRTGVSGDEVTILRLADFKDAVRVHGNERVIKLDEKEKKKYALEKGDILIIRVNGSVDLAGRFIEYTQYDKMEGFCDHFIRIRLDTSRVNSTYLTYVANHGDGRHYLKNSLSTSAGQNTINQGSIKGLKLLLPSIQEQELVVSRVSDLFKYTVVIEEQVQSALDRVNNLTQSILAKAFRGELTAEWREANPELISGENSAEALLERIKAERSAKSVTKRGRGKA
ncbi:TPA: restriction endonuclease subunit S [Acinetobacter baumannii]|nr:restriction endonuclease subunit S [Acinetobacter baumannii]